MRLAALSGLTLAAATLVLAVLAAFREFPQGLIVIACIAVSLLAAIVGLLHRGRARGLALVLATVLLGASVVVLATRFGLLTLLLVVGAALTIATVTSAFRIRVALPTAPRPRRPVLFFNPRSGGGKAERFGLAAEENAPDRGGRARTRQGSRGARASAVAGGADALAMAGGDGSQAIVAAVAA